MKQYQSEMDSASSFLYDAVLSVVRSLVDEGKLSASNPIDAISISYEDDFVGASPPMLGIRDHQTTLQVPRLDSENHLVFPLWCPPEWKYFFDLGAWVTFDSSPWAGLIPALRESDLRLLERLKGPEMWEEAEENTADDAQPTPTWIFETVAVTVARSLNLQLACSDLPLGETFVAFAHHSHMCHLGYDLRMSIDVSKREVLGLVGDLPW